MPRLQRVIPVLLLSLLAVQALAVNQFTPMLEARKYAEVERLAGARLAARPDDVEAITAKASAISAQGERRIDEAVKVSEGCVAAFPQNSDCHASLGETLGNKAMQAGIMASMGYVGKIRDAFVRAVELDPKNYSARISLLQYYQLAPSFVGGGSARAQTLIADTAKVNPDAARILQARLDIADDKYPQAETSLLSANAGGEHMLLRSQSEALYQLSMKYIDRKKFADAERILQELQKRNGASDLSALGMGRSMVEQGKAADAVVHFEKALAIDARPTTYYRLGLAWVALKDKPRAAAAFEKALAPKVGLPEKFKIDAEEQLKSLRS